MANLKQATCITVDTSWMEHQKMIDSEIECLEKLLRNWISEDGSADDSNTTKLIKEEGRELARAPCSEMFFYFVFVNSNLIHMKYLCWRFKTIQLLYTWTLCNGILMSHLLWECKQRIKDIEVQDTKTRFGVTTISYDLYTSFLFWYAVQLLPG